ncbi:MAG: ATP-grasp domain-containing protein [Planctomycetota bacterium]
MRKLRILVLVHEVCVPPPNAADLDWEETWPYQMELDVQTTLRELGHEVQVLGVDNTLRPIRETIAEFKPHVAFNILSDFHGITSYEAHVVSYLELLKQPYTGCNPRGIAVANDKSLCKKILAWHGIRTPAFAAFSPGRKAPRLPKDVEFPVIVKSAMEHGSTGISQASVVHNDAQLEKRVAYMREKVGGEIIAEQFIPGRELTVAIVGNGVLGGKLDVLPVWEVWYDNLPRGNHAIATEQVKWNVEYAQSIGIKTGPARDLDDKKRRAVQKIARDTFTALELSGYARIDLRMDEQGQVYVIEANVNPDLTAIEDFAEAAEAYGMDYGQLLQRIIDAGMRYPAPWKLGPNKKYQA